MKKLIRKIKQWYADCGWSRAALAAVLLFVVFALTGCGLAQPVLDIVLGSPASDLSPVDTPTAALHSKLNWLSMLSIIGIAFSAAATVNGQIKLAMPIFAGCVAALGVSLAVIQYGSWLAIGSLIAAVCIFLYSVLIKNRAVKELIGGAQKLKSTNANGSKILFDSQSVSTRKMVNKVKDVLKMKGKL